MSNEPLLIQALNGRNHSGRPPIWLMRQAGRYLPEYRKVRESHSFLEMCKLSEVAAEVTRQPLRRFPLDAAIVFADILLLLDALGRGLHFKEKVGPLIERPWEPGESLPNISVEETLGYVAETIRILREDLSVPLIGFAGAPFTVASYLIEGRSSKDLKKTKRLLWSHPEAMHGLLNQLADYTIEYLQMQVRAGAQALQIFDSWANVLAFKDFEKWSLFYMRKVVDALKPMGVPIIAFCRGSSVWPQSLASLDTAISLDWNSDLASVRRLLPHTPLQGNLDPHLVYAPPEILEARARDLIESMEGDPAWVFNMGHGILPDMTPEQVGRLIDIVHSFEPART